jgi:hypothetical protein
MFAKTTAANATSSAKDLSGGHSEPRCGNVPLTRTPDNHTRDRSAPQPARDLLWGDFSGTGWAARPGAPPLRYYTSPWSKTGLCIEGSTSRQN